MCRATCLFQHALWNEHFLWLWYCSMKQFLSVIVWESVPEVENVGRPILMKLAPEVGLIEIFQKPSWFCSLTFSSKVTGGSHLGPPEHEKSCFWKGKFGKPQKQTNKALSIIHCMLFFWCKGSFSSRMPIWHRRFWQSVAWHKFWPCF